LSPADQPRARPWRAAVGRSRYIARDLLQPVLLGGRPIVLRLDHIQHHHRMLAPTHWTKFV
jgi:hypothetical protein